jgi:hypothetical protein
MITDGTDTHARGGEDDVRAFRDGKSNPSSWEGCAVAQLRGFGRRDGT